MILAGASEGAHHDADGLDDRVHKSEAGPNHLQHDSNEGWQATLMPDTAGIVVVSCWSYRKAT